MSPKKYVKQLSNLNNTKAEEICEGSTKNEIKETLYIFKKSHNFYKI